MKIAGLRRGADAYLAKPFNEEELRVRMKQLLLLRRELREKYSAAEYLTGPISETIEEQETPLEDKFLVRIRKVIEDHIDDYELDVGNLCRELGMSRSPVHKKLKALTGQSTTEFIRYIRLHKAKELLKDPKLHISEIAYDTGFRNPNYFTRTFGELFGMSPSEFRESGSVEF